MFPPINLIEVDTVTATVIVDNEIDVLSTTPSVILNDGRMSNLIFSQPQDVHSRGGATREVPMEAICCGAHGLSILVTVTKGHVSHSLLFDTGPEEDAWEKNANRLGVDLASIERIQLSHWHRDHSGGMVKAVQMIMAARASSLKESNPVTVDLHPNRPDYRGFMAGPIPVSLQADPSFSEIEESGAIIDKNANAHSVLDDMFLISGEIPRVTNYETGIKNGIRFEKEKGTWEKDEDIMDERFLMCNLKGKGIILFTGCSHGGVINASRHALQLLDTKVPLYAVIGGFHLVGEQEANIDATVKDFKELSPKVLLPGHCSGWRVKGEIEKEMPGTMVPCTVGSRFIF